MRLLPLALFLLMHDSHGVQTSGDRSAPLLVTEFQRCVVQRLRLNARFLAGFLERGLKRTHARLDDPLGQAPVTIGGRADQQHLPLGIFAFPLQTTGQDGRLTVVIGGAFAALLTGREWPGEAIRQGTHALDQLQTHLAGAQVFPAPLEGQLDHRRRRQQLGLLGRTRPLAGQPDQRIFQCRVMADDHQSLHAVRAGAHRLEQRRLVLAVKRRLELDHVDAEAHRLHALFRRGARAKGRRAQDGIRHQRLLGKPGSHALGAPLAALLEGSMEVVSCH